MYSVTFALMLLNKEAWQSVSRGAGVTLFWRESQCKNAKVNKEWLLLRNKQRERACKVDSVVQGRESRWASFSSAKARCVRKYTWWNPSTTSINRRLNGFLNCIYLCSKLLLMDGFKEMNCIKTISAQARIMTHWETGRCYFTTTSTIA